MSFYGNTDFGAKVSLGLVPGWATVNKFGRATDADNGSLTDIWDGADGSTSTKVWVAPTTARIHNVTSTSTADDGDPVGTGARTVEIFGLTGWGTNQVSETVTLDGTSNVATANSYVIIHRMVCRTFGSGGTNAGIITATAQTDATVTAAILAGNGQTEMAIYGVPSTQKLLITNITAGILKSTGATARGDGRLVVKENASSSDSGFVVKSLYTVAGDNSYFGPITPPLLVTGPCIVKLQVTSTVDGSDAVGEFDAYLVNN